MNNTYKTLGIIAIIAVLSMLLSIPACGLGSKPSGGDSALTGIGVWMFLVGFFTLPAVAILATIVGIYDALRPKRQVQPAAPLTPPPTAPAPPGPPQP